MNRIIGTAVTLAAVAWGQTQVDLRTQSKSVDFSAAVSTKPVTTGTLLPATCGVGQMFFLSNAPAGQNVYGCTATNTWTVQSGGGGGGGGGSVTVQSAGTPVGTNSTLNFSGGAGIVYAISSTGSAISIQSSSNTAVTPTLSSEQAGGVRLCASASGSATTYSCAMSPTLTLYTAGMILDWKPDVSASGGATTLNVDFLGATPVKLADGVTNPGPEDILTGRLQLVWFDGAAFRLLNNNQTTSTGVRLCASASGSATTYTCAGSPTLFSYTSGMILDWKPDVTATGGAITLNVDSLGATAVKLPDGVTNPAAGDLVAGRLQQIWFDGTVFRLITQVTRPGVSLCASASGSATTYTCAGSPTLFSYTSGMILDWKPDVTGTGGAITLNVDSLGATAVKLPDGVTNPAAGDLVAGRLQQIWFDGTVFRLVIQVTRPGVSLCASASGSATTYTCAGSPTLFSYTSGMILDWKPDVTATGGAITLNVDSLGATAVKLPDGVTNPALGDLVAGRLQQIWFDGTVFRLVIQVTRPGVSLCASASGSATTYTCAGSPTLFSYTSGMILDWKPDVTASSGAITLNVDSLGATAVKLPDGITNPGPGDLVAGRMRQLWFDGTVFRFIDPVVPAGVLGEALPTCNVAVRGRLWFVAGATGVKDALSVCAQDATNTFAWRTLY